MRPLCDTVHPRPHCVGIKMVLRVELEMNLREFLSFSIMECGDGIPNVNFHICNVIATWRWLQGSLLKVPTCAFTFKTLC